MDFPTKETGVWLHVKLTPFHEIAANIGYNCDIFWSRSNQLLII